jgi:hypothetical protein
MRSGVFVLAAFAALAGCAGSSTTIPTSPSQAAQVPQESGGLAPAEGLAQAAPAATAKPTATPTPKATAKPTPKPTATPAVYPLVNGDQFTYAFAYETDNTVGNQTTYIQLNATLTAVLSGPTTYNGVPAYELRTTGNTTSGTVPASLDYVDYVNLITSGGHTEYVDYGYDHADVLDRCCGVTEHDDTKVDYATPFIRDVLPETAGEAWNEPVAMKETIDDYDHTPENSPNILSGTETIAGDGSYQGSGMNYDVAESRLLRSDGTGYVVDGPANGARQWAYALPGKDSSGHEVIPATESYDSKSATNLVPDWYPGGGAPANPLVRELTRNYGASKTPAKCGKRAGTSATLLVTSYTQLDPIIGYTDDETIDIWVLAGSGAICTIDVAVKKNYDNEVKGTLTKTTTTSTIWVLLSEILK